ncbi:DUF4365 domain-containing protein [Pseudomonas sp. PhalM4]
MKYPLSTAIGDAGEYFFAYQISHVLGWPCRLFDIDIGIDAQVEILDESRNSTGRFAAFQIKTSAGDDFKPSWYVSERQLDYWRELDNPVFVVLVDIKDQAMYLHRIQKDFTYRVTEGKSVRIDFDLTQDKFSEASGKTIKAAAEGFAMESIRAHLEKVKDGIQAIHAAIDNQEDPDPFCMIEAMSLRNDFRAVLSDAQAIASATRVGIGECEQVENDLEDAIQKLKETMEEWGMAETWVDDRLYGEEIHRFLGEY